MDRSSALAPLSRDHRVALIVARQLTKAEQADALAAASRFVGFLARHELVHFALEESLLLPAMPDELRAQALAQRMLEDHEYLRLAARQLADALQPASPEYLHELGRRLRSHVQMEERELFPYIEQTLDPARLEELGARLTGEHGE